jgi:uncharacterized membrane protein
MNLYSDDRAHHRQLFVNGLGLVAIVILALIVRFHGISVPVIWYDEAYSLLLSEKSPRLIWFTTTRDVHPPLYYLLLHYWMTLSGNSVLAVRGLSALVDVGTVLLGMKLMSLVASRRATWIAALLLALLPISVRYSQEVRMYTMVAFWLMGATVAFVCWVKAPQHLRYPVVYVLLMSAAFYTNYFAALCALVHWLYWWGLRIAGRGTALPVRPWLLANGAIVLLYLPWLPHFMDQLLHIGGLGWIPPVTWQTLLGAVAQFTVMKDANSSVLWAIVLSALVVLAAAMLVLKDRSDRRFSLLLVGYFFVPVLTVFLVSWVVPVFVARYLVFAALGLPLIAAVALDALAERRAIIAFMATVVLVMGEIQGLLIVYAQQDDLNGTSVRKVARMDTVAAGINQLARADDEIVVDGLYWYLPFMYYNSTGIQPRLYVSRSRSGESRGPYNYGGWVIIPERLDWIFFNDVSALRLNASRVWWVTGKPQPEDVVKFPVEWKQTMTITGGELEARLFILEGRR